MEKISKLIVALFLAQVLVFTGCESREHSIIRENSYVAEHKVEEVAHYWDEVEWTRVDGVKLTMDISAPESKDLVPCVMIIHGGGWTLHTNTIMEGMARYITNRGYVVFNINYRTLAEGVQMEQIVEDVMGALIWVKEHAREYGGDPSRIAVTGDSAGGHLTAMILTQAGNPKFKPSYQGNGKTDLSVTCAAPSYGVFDFVGMSKWAPSITKGYLGASYKEAPERYRLLSPALNLKKGMPPQLVIVGNRDPLYRENKKYVEAVKALGNPIEFWVYEGQTHAFLNYFWDERGIKGYDRILKFFDEQLKK